MNCISQCATLAQSEQSRRTRAFRKSSTLHLDPGAVARQARISLLAFGAYLQREDALAFLNGRSAILNARPLDMAALSDEGLAAAIAALAVPKGRHGSQFGPTASGAFESAEAVMALPSENPDRGRADG